jgi:hypothetical protein
MPRRHKHKHRTMRGGFLDDISNTLSGWGTSISEGASSAWEKTKNATSSLTGSTPSTSYTPTTSYQSPMTTSTYGGKYSRRRRHMKGGYRDNSPTSGLAAHAAPFSGPTAQPQVWLGVGHAQPEWLGGRTRRRHRRGRKSRKHRRH